MLSNFELLKKNIQLAQNNVINVVSTATTNRNCLGCSNIFSPLPFGWDVLLCLGTSETRDKAAIKLGLMYTYRQQAEGLQSPE